ncbi:hypothetical protein BDV36DRAFT_295215 [Aspergillus pseudocaelatus]|uniref:Uncharacterized protein n=1 Tax=Aspergillus pseudocaelatus TaxID=1825620 RepID=A0ABQ6WMV7_9EURO|nr:hypothetical protein BDV36DRAFT_295215 [Aspergillus pseudocaelatus]
MAPRRTYKRTTKYDGHRTKATGKGKKGDKGKGKGKKPDAKEQDAARERGKYCYAKVTAHVARREGYLLFYQACGRLILRSEWEIFYRSTLYSEDEIKAEDGHIMSVLVNSSGREPAEEEVLDSFWEALEPAQDEIRKVNARQWDVYEEVFKTAVEVGLEEVQQRLLIAFDNLFIIDMSQDPSVV